MTIYEKLSAIQSELKAPKSQYNLFGKYNYRNCEDILEAVKPLCGKYKAVCTIGDEVTLIGERYYIKATARLIDVESPADKIENTAYAREEAEKKGMDGSQVTGASSSYARKYALGMAKGQETEFVSMLQEKNKKMTKSDLSEKAKECDEAEKRIAVLDRIIQNLYEDKVSGTLSEERFIKLSKNYESEQAELTDKVKFLKEELMAVQKETADINKFMRLIKRYSAF